MPIEDLREFLWPVKAEQDDGFRAEVERLGRRALRVIGVIEIVMPLLGAAAYHLLAGGAQWTTGGAINLLASIGLGILTYWSAGTYWGSRYSRGLAALSGVLSIAIGIVTQIQVAMQGLTEQLNGSMSILIVLLVGLALIPMQPAHALALGAGGVAVYLCALRYAAAGGWIAADSIMGQEFIGLPLMVLLGAALAGVSYQRFAESWKSNQDALAAAEELRQSEGRTLIAESAAGMNRLAAAVSHELNSPLGAMKSAADTLPAALDRMASAPPEQQARLRKVAGSLSETMAQSAARMSEIVSRMQRFTNLDRAEVLEVDLNRLLADIAEMIRANAPWPVRIETDCADLPKLSSRPQLLGSVFLILIHLAVERAGQEGSVRVASQCAETEIHVVVGDTGPLLSPAEITRLFNPDFRVTGERVSTGDWSLFTARRLVQEVGGDLHSRPGTGSGQTFVVILPRPERAGL